MKNKKEISGLYDTEKLEAVYCWAIGVQSFFRQQKETIVKVSKEEMINKFQEVINLLKEEGK